MSRLAGILSLLLVFQSRPGLALTTNSGAWGLTHWTTEQGLPQNTVKALTQTPDGYLWVGTLGGLARFDGISFSTFTPANTPGLLSDAVNALSVDSAGTLWIGTGGGLSEWRNGLVRSWTLAEGLPARAVYQIVVRPKGGVWWRAGNSCGITSQGQTRAYGTDDGLASRRILSIATGGNGSLLVMSARGLQRLKAGEQRFSEHIPWPRIASDWHGMELGSGHVLATSGAGNFQLESGE